MKSFKYIIAFLILGVFLFSSMKVKEPNNETISSSSSKHEIVLATWNVGHFSNGGKSYSTIGPKQYNDKVKGFRKILYDSLSADLIGINEYSAIFGKSKSGKESLSSEILFNKFEYKNEGKKSWICNSIFSNIDVYNVKRFFYKNTISNVFNYLSADIFIDGEKVQMIYVHLTSRDTKQRSKQMKELIEKYKNYKRIIIFGDFNLRPRFMKAFKDDGYILANDGSLITFPSKSIAIDNILVKGLKISDVRVVKTDLSDHYPLVCRISIK